MFSGRGSSGKPSHRASSLDRLAQMVFPGEWLYRDAHYLAAEVEVDGAAAQRWLPAPLRLAEPVATVFTAFFPHTSFGSAYREAGVFLPVRQWRGTAIHCPWMLVDDDVALIVGRELLGYPKKLGEMTWSLEGERIESTVARRGSTLLTMRGTLGRTLADPPPFLGRPHRNVRASLGLAVPWVLGFTPHEESVEVRDVDLEVDFGSSERDPLAELGWGRQLSARLHRVNLGRGGIPRPVGIASPLSYARSLLRRIH